MRKIWKLICMGILLVAAAVILAGCGESGGGGEGDEEIFEVKGYMSHSMSYREALGEDPHAEGLENAGFCAVAAVVKNNSENKYQMVLLEPVAYDSDGNVIENAFSSFYFDDEEMTSYKEEKAQTVAMNISAGESEVATDIYRLADGIEEPDHIEWKVGRKTKVNSETPSVGLEVTDVVYDDYEVTFTVKNNSDNDCDGVEVWILPTDADGYLLSDLLLYWVYGEDDQNPTLVPAHSEFTHSLSLWYHDSEDGLPADVQVFASVIDEEPAY